MHALLAKFLQHDVQQYVSELATIESAVSPDSPPQFDEHFARLSKASQASVAGCRRFEEQSVNNDELLAEARGALRSAIEPWFGQSWFMQRARCKPRGYPGDFELLTRIYDNQPRGTGVGGYLDLYFLNMPLAEAVRSRLETARRFLQSEIRAFARPVSILNVACGPAREFSHQWRPTDSSVTATLIDMDQEALAFAQNAIDGARPGNLRFHTRVHNALRMSSAENNLRLFGPADIIYSIGLCDYIPDNYLVRILRGWRESLAPGGVVYVAFKDCREYDATGYAWHVDWHFVARTEDHCRRLFEDAGYEMDDVEMSRSESPIILNFACRSSPRTASCATRRANTDAGVVVR